MEENHVCKDPEIVAEKIRDYVKSVHSFMDDINQLQKECDNGTDGFVDKHLGRFGEIFGHVVTLWTSLGCKTATEFNTLMKDKFAIGKNNEGLAEVLEDYLKSEEAWDAFLNALDDTVSNQAIPSKGTTLELEEFETPGKVETVEDLISGFKFTWMIFLRNFS